jgi:alpha-D-ribose 1-methylphosphonate 5-triphosphate synthase subunit PhnG
MENTYKQLSYLDLGFSPFLTRPPMSGSPLGDILERSIRTNTLRDAAVTNEKIQSLSIDKLTAGTITVQASIGSTGNVFIDGTNKRIMVNDGTNDRVLLGYLAGKF